MTSETRILDDEPEPANVWTYEIIVRVTDDQYNFKLYELPIMVYKVTL